MQPMRQMKYEVKFLTPAFLGNAEQSGQWRTPPFKALLRQWWRVAVAAEFRYDYKELRKAEGQLFGHAWLKSDKDRNGNAVHARASRVRIRLDRWSEGKETRTCWGNQEIRPPGWKIRHPEVGQPIGPLLYLGYGPLKTRSVGTSDRKEFATALKQNAAIQSGESATLSIAVPANHEDEMRVALALMSAYGAIGGRSRNGWGSFSLLPRGDPSPAPDVNLAQFRRPWRDALEVDWVHALGVDDQWPLIWQTTHTDEDWRQIMRNLAIVKIGVRTLFSLNGPPHRTPVDRHWLSYPITRHPTAAWRKTSGRLPNSLRFKVRQDSENPEKLRGVIFHAPCLPTREFSPCKTVIERVWERVHQFLDGPATVALERISE